MNGRINVSNYQNVDGMEMLLIGLYRLAKSSTFVEMESVFGKSSGYLCRVFNGFIEYLYENFMGLINNNIKKYIELFEESYKKIYSMAYAANDNHLHPFNWNSFRVCCFLDCKNIQIDRPGGGEVYLNGIKIGRLDNDVQRAFFTGWKKFHGIKYQTVELPCGLTCDVFGPETSRNNDNSLYNNSNINERFRASQINIPPDLQYTIFGDSAYQLDTHVRSYDGSNTFMKSIRICNEWTYGELCQLFPYMDWKHNFQIMCANSTTTTVFYVCSILRNCHACLYGNQTSNYFKITPPSLEWFLEYNPNV